MKPSEIISKKVAELIEKYNIEAKKATEFEVEIIQLVLDVWLEIELDRKRK